jgi:CTP synthase
MQCAVIEFGRNVLGLTDANSTEMNADTKHPVIAMMEEQKNRGEQGRHHALGRLPVQAIRGKHLATVYGRKDITERHRHRYEFNNAYLEALPKKAGHGGHGHQSAG